MPLPIPVFNSLGSNRDELLALRAGQREKLLTQRVLVIDPRRQRPRWFDGRFLAAHDLANEQNYFLVRQADLGRAGGAGVVEGLQVALITDPQTQIPLLQISAGSGVTDSGELVMLRANLTFNPADVPEIHRLDGAFGLQVIPNEPGRTRTGLYVVALRAVEWTANPIAAYPTSLTGDRKVEDGDIIEGVAVSLIPYPALSDADPARRRAHVAREIFVEGRDWGQVAGTLPLAMVELRGNLVEWVDCHMVRRDAGAERSVGMDFGFGARALREAHLLQYREHLAAAMEVASGQPFPAAAWFDALPAAGQMPLNTINSRNLTQRFFPPGIAVELSFVPDDELPALIEESLLLPPMDLTGEQETLEGIGVLVLAALPRADWNKFRTRLSGLTIPLRSPQLQARPGLASLLASRMAPTAILAADARLAVPAEAVLRDPRREWQSLVQRALKTPLVWYVRRRNLPERANLAGVPVPADAVGKHDREKLADLVENDAQVKKAYIALRSAAGPEVEPVVNELARKTLTERPALLKSLLARMPKGEGAQPPPSHLVLAALSPALDPHIGEGSARLEKANEALGIALTEDKLANTGILVDVDRLARDIVPSEKFQKLVAGLTEAVKLNKLNAATLEKLRQGLE